MWSAASHAQGGNVRRPCGHRINGVDVTAGKVWGILVLFLGLGTFARADAKTPSSAGAGGAQGNEDFFEMSIEELMDVRIDTVYVASKRAQRLEETPASATVVTAEEIRLYGYRTLAEILQSTPGFYLSYDRMLQYMGTRGFQRPGGLDSRILVLIDGHRMSDNIAGAPPSGMEFPLDVELIDRVEIIRGPGSSLYGSNAVLAIINVITKRGSAVRGLELSGQTGSFDTHRGRVTYGNLLGKDVDLLLSAGSQASDGSELYFREFDAPQTNNGWVDNDDGQDGRVAAILSWGDLSFMLVHGAHEKGIPMMTFSTAFGDPRTRMLTEGTLAGLTWTGELSDWYTAKARVSFGRLDFDGRYVFDFDGVGEDPAVINGDSWDRTTWKLLYGRASSGERLRVPLCHGGSGHCGSRSGRRAVGVPESGADTGPGRRAGVAGPVGGGAAVAHQLFVRRVRGRDVRRGPGELAQAPGETESDQAPGAGAAFRRARGSLREQGQDAVRRLCGRFRSDESDAHVRGRLPAAGRNAGSIFRRLSLYGDSNMDDRRSESLSIVSAGINGLPEGGALGATRGSAP